MRVDFGMLGDETGELIAHAPHLEVFVVPPAQAFNRLQEETSICDCGTLDGLSRFHECVCENDDWIYPGFDAR